MAPKPETYRELCLWSCDTQIEYDPNGKPESSHGKSAARYRVYAAARTVGEAIALGSGVQDLLYDFEKGLVRRTGGPRRAQPLDPTQNDLASLSKIDRILAKWGCRKAMIREECSIEVPGEPSCLNVSFFRDGKCRCPTCVVCWPIELESTDALRHHRLALREARRQRPGPLAHGGGFHVRRVPINESSKVGSIATACDADGTTREEVEDAARPKRRLTDYFMKTMTNGVNEDDTTTPPGTKRQRRTCKNAPDEGIDTSDPPSAEKQPYASSTLGGFLGHLSRRGCLDVDKILGARAA